MSNVTSVPGSTPTPELPPESGISSTPETAAPAETEAPFAGLGSWFRRTWARLLSHGDHLRRTDGDATPSRPAKEILAQDSDTTFGSLDEIKTAYQTRLTELDSHFKGRLAGAGSGAERKTIKAEARRADFELTKLYADKGRAHATKDTYEGFVGDLLEAKTGLEGLGVTAQSYLQDMDKDGLSARAELVAGSSDRAIDTDLDGLTDLQEIRAGLDPASPRSEAGIESKGWSINGYVWYPYFDDKPVLAFNKYDAVFGADTSREFEAFFEGYAAGEQGPRGTWVPRTGGGRPGYVQESNFASTSGVNPIDDPLVSSAAVRLMRRSGAPQDARFALRDQGGAPLEIEDGDSLRPTFLENGEVKLAEARSVDGRAIYFKPQSEERVHGTVAYRPIAADGTIKGGVDARVESRADLLELKPGLRFDFLDAKNDTVSFDSSRGDKVVAAFPEGDQWIALVPERDDAGAVTGYEKLTYDKDGESVTDRAQVTTGEGRALLDAHEADAMYRVLDGSSQALRGDGEASSYFDVYWWGKCHNTAKIDQSNLPQPELPVQVVRGLEPGETLAAAFDKDGVQNVLRPVRGPEGDVDAYVLEGGSGEGRLTLAEARAIAEENSATPVIIGEDGAVRQAETITVSPEEVQTMVAHMGSGATENKGATGSRFYGSPDNLSLADGRSLNDVRIVSATLESGDTVEVQRREGGEWKDLTRGLFRGGDISHDRRSHSWRSAAYSQSSMASINESREDKIASLTVHHPDGREETLDASEVQSVAREDAYDMSPADIWKAAQMIEDGKSFTLEKATGPQVWNYAVKDMATERIDQQRIPASALKADDLPGAKAGTTDKEGRLYFKTTMNYLENGEVNEKNYFYWVNMDEEGQVTDYNYLVDPDDTDATFASTPDFFWQTHVKDPVEERWAGEAEISGASMGDIQGLYNASVGHMDHLGVFGVFTAEDLSEGRPRRPS